MNSTDIKSYMQSVGREARAASRLVAKADTATKNHALTAMANAIRRDEALLLAANAKDLDNARAKGLEAAMIDRLMHHGEAIVIQGESYRTKDGPKE